MARHNKGTEGQGKDIDKFHDDKKRRATEENYWAIT
jgi:hypothetical protein